MKRQLKYYLVGIIFLLMCSMNTSIPTARCSDEKPFEYTFISQEQINRNAIQALSYIFSHTPSEAATLFSDKGSSLKHTFIKYTTLLLIRDTDKRTLKQTLCTDKLFYFWLHPKPVSYYIYTLERIII